MNNSVPYVDNNNACTLSRLCQFVPNDLTVQVKMKSHDRTEHGYNFTEDGNSFRMCHTHAEMVIPLLAWKELNEGEL